MNTRKTIVLLLGLAAILTVAGSCKRDGVNEPSLLTSPSTIASLFKMNASQNAIVAGDSKFGASRGVVNVTATLTKFDGTPITNKSVYFEITDSGGTPTTNIGYFEGGGSVKSATTDSRGVINLNYYGPYAQEIASNMQVNIVGTVGWPGKESVQDFLPLIIIGNFNSEMVDYYINPDVIYADENKPKTTITAQLIYGGFPIQGYKVYFLVQEGSPGYFDDQLRSTFRETDSQGIAKITYIGPNMNEIAGDTSVYFRLQLTEKDFWEGGDPSGTDDHGKPFDPKLALRVIRKR